MTLIPLPPMAVTREGVTFYVYPESPPGNPRFWSPSMTWEAETYAALAAHLRPGGILLDVGAWVGPFTAWASARAAYVLALEPDPVAFRALKQNIQLNGPGMAQPLGCAAGKGELVRLYHAREPGDSQTSSRLPHGVGFQAEATRVDDLRPYMPGPPTVIKIDCEGMEAEVLGGAMRTIVDHRPVILLSTHPGYLHEADWAVLDCVARIYGTTIDHADPGPHVLALLIASSR